MLRFLSCFFLALFISSPSLFAFEGAVVSAHPSATKAGIDILKQGGSAIDAAVATAFALSVVEPHNSGLGGGGFLLYYHAKTKKFYFVDYREAAPKKATAEYYKENPQHLIKGSAAPGVPGFLLGMETIHKKWQRLPWAKVLEPSINLAKQGVPLQGKLREAIKDRQADLELDPEMKNFYVDALKTKQARINQTNLAKILQDVQANGSSIFYKGWLAKLITNYMTENNGLITAEDLANYKVYFREPYQFDYKKYQITTAPLPSSAGEGLNLLFRRSVIYHIDKEFSHSPRGYGLILQSFKDYFNYREVALGDTTSNIIGHTTHLSVIDTEGNMAAMTNTLNFRFGAGVMIPDTGIILNNELNDFSHVDYSANKIRPGRRPLSSMSPTIVFENEQPYLVIGTPGGTTIPQNLFQIFYFSWEWNTPFSEAIKKPKIYYNPRTDEVIVEDGVKGNVLKHLEPNNRLKTKDQVGDVQALYIKNKDKTFTYSDERGEGKGMTLSSSLTHQRSTSSSSSSASEKEEVKQLEESKKELSNESSKLPQDKLETTPSSENKKEAPLKNQTLQPSHDTQESSETKNQSESKKQSASKKNIRSNKTTTTKSSTKAVTTTSTSSKSKTTNKSKTVASDSDKKAKNTAKKSDDKTSKILNPTSDDFPASTSKTMTRRKKTKTTSVNENKQRKKEELQKKKEEEEKNGVQPRQKTQNKYR